jgi:hypothetical protein
MDTIDKGRFEDTNILFEQDTKVDYHVKTWFDNTHDQLLLVIKRWMERNNV